MSRPYARNRVVIRGAGEMASGVIRHLSMAGFDVIALEQPAPTCIRRSVCYAEAVYEGEVSIEGVTSVLISSAEDAVSEVLNRRVPLMIDPNAEQLPFLTPEIVVDGRARSGDTGGLAEIIIDANPDRAIVLNRVDMPNQGTITLVGEHDGQVLDEFLRGEPHGAILTQVAYCIDVASQLFTHLVNSHAPSLRRDAGRR